MHIQLQWKNKSLLNEASKYLLVSKLSKQPYLKYKNENKYDGPTLWIRRDFSKGYNYIHDEQQWVSLFTFSNDWDWEQVKVAFEIKAETSRQASLATLYSRPAVVVECSTPHAFHRKTALHFCTMVDWPRISKWIRF